MNTTGIRCGNCKSAHPTTADVKACFARKYDLQDRVSTLATRSAAAVEQARLREIAAFGRSNLPTRPVSPARSFQGRNRLDVSGYESDAGRCGRCAGTGEFITGLHNGVPTGPGGICFRCGGKGVQVSCGTGAHVYTPGVSACCDITRNASYDAWGVRISL